MVQANQSYNVILMGSMGVGKSTICNALTGLAQGSGGAATAGGGESCTKNPTKYVSAVHSGLTIIDTPGLGDPTISMRQWTASATTLTSTPIDAIVMVLNGVTRVSMENQFYAIAIKNLLKGCKPSRMFFVITRSSDAGLLGDDGEAKAQKVINTLWTACKFGASFPEPLQCTFRFEKDNATRQSDNTYAVGRWLCGKVQGLSAQAKMNVITPEELPDKMREIGREAVKVNQDFADLVEDDCWPRSSPVLRLNKMTQQLESVPLSSLRLDDEVMVMDPRTKFVRRERVTYLHDHGLEKNRQRDRLVTAAQLLIDAGDGQQVTYTLTHSHIMPVYRTVDGSEAFLQISARDLEVGDVVVTRATGDTHSRGVIACISTVSLRLDDCILVWTPSMNLLVHGVASSCRTEGFDALSDLSRSLVSLVARHADDQMYDMDSSGRKFARFLGFRGV